MREVLRMEGNARERRPALQGPARAGHRDRAPRTQGAAGAPAHGGRRHPPVGRKQADDGLVLAELQSAGARGAVALIARKPRRRNESDRLEPEREEPRAPSRDPFPGRRLMQGEELTLPDGAAPGSKLVAQPARQADFVVALAVEHDLGTIGYARPEPADEIRMRLKRPRSVPVRHYQQGGPDGARGAQLPQALHAIRERRGDVVDRDEQAHDASRSR